MTNSEPYTLDSYVADLKRITRETDNEYEIITQVAPLAKPLAAKAAAPS